MLHLITCDCGKTWYNTKGNPKSSIGRKCPSCSGKKGKERKQKPKPTQEQEEQMVL